MQRVCETLGTIHVTLAGDPVCVTESVIMIALTAGKEGTSHLASGSAR